MRNCLCIILFLVLSLTIPAASAYAYGDGGGDSGGDGEERATSPYQSSGPPCGWKPLLLPYKLWRGETSSKTDPGKGKKVRALVSDIKKAAKEGEVEGDSTDSAEGTTSDEKAPDENTSVEDQVDKKNISEEGTDKIEDITNDVRNFISQMQQFHQGMQPAADAFFQAADRAERAERVKHVNNFCQKNGFKPPDLRDNRNLIKWENAVKEIEKNRMTDEEYKHYKIEQAAIAKCKKEHAEELAEAARMEEEHEKITLAPMRAFVKFGMDVTVTLFSGGVGGLTGPAISIAYSVGTSDDPVKGGAVQAVVEVVTFGKSAPINFVIGKTGEAVVEGLGEVRERQQQRD